MKQKFNKIIGVAILLLAFSLNATPVKAQVCSTPPTCEELGFKQKASDCKETLKFLKCPLDQNKMFCLTAKDIPSSNAKVGDILYSDMTTASNIVASKTPIGVVFDKVNRLAIALRQAKKNWMMGNDCVDIPDLGFCSTAQCDIDGKVNTQILIAFGSANEKSYPAAEYCNNYTTKGTTTGQWFLPSFAQLSTLYASKTVVNKTLAKIDGDSIQSEMYWSSTRRSENSSWYFSISDGKGYQSTEYTNNGGYTNYYVAYNRAPYLIALPMIEF